MFQHTILPKCFNEKEVNENGYIAHGIVFLNIVTKSKNIRVIIAAKRYIAQNQQLKLSPVVIFAHDNALNNIKKIIHLNIVAGLVQILRSCLDML